MECLECGLRLPNDAVICERCGTPTKEIDIVSNIDSKSLFSENMDKFSDFFDDLTGGQDVNELVKKVLKNTGEEKSGVVTEKRLRELLKDNFGEEELEVLLPTILNDTDNLGNRVFTFESFENTHSAFGDENDEKQSDYFLRDIIENVKYDLLMKNLNSSTSLKSLAGKSNDDTQVVRDMLKNIDVDGDGEINRSELYEYLCNFFEYDIADGYAEKFFTMYDKNNSGFVSTDFSSKILTDIVKKDDFDVEDVIDGLDEELNKEKEKEDNSESNLVSESKVNDVVDFLSQDLESSEEVQHESTISELEDLINSMIVSDESSGSSDGNIDNAYELASALTPSNIFDDLDDDKEEVTTNLEKLNLPRRETPRDEFQKDFEVEDNNQKNDTEEESDYKVTEADFDDLFEEDIVEEDIDQENLSKDNEENSGETTEEEVVVEEFEEPEELGEDTTFEEFLEEQNVEDFQEDDNVDVENDMEVDLSDSFGLNKNEEPFGLENDNVELGFEEEDIEKFLADESYFEENEVLNLNNEDENEENDEFDEPEGFEEDLIDSEEDLDEFLSGKSEFFDDEELEYILYKVKKDMVAQKLAERNNDKVSFGEGKVIGTIRRVFGNVKFELLNVIMAIAVISCLVSMYFIFHEPRQDLYYSNYSKQYIIDYERQVRKEVYLVAGSQEVLADVLYEYMSNKISEKDTLNYLQYHMDLSSNVSDFLLEKVYTEANDYTYACHMYVFESSTLTESAMNAIENGDISKIPQVVEDLNNLTLSEYDIYTLRSSFLNAIGIDSNVSFGDDTIIN